ncbi:Dis3-like exonuclease [Thalictrum thalictroides]|uniref:Dis3-like exonuclease n=1 Tax=Thalictrum thalictroides TaxID=46969 RepID=A0A7J6VAY1_THATH|nr:Dis3-like exonuclease [Thalictrum thalictroides]
MAAAIGWYGPLIDLCRANSHLDEYVQLLVFVHTTRPIQKFKSSKGGALLRTDVQVGDDTRPFFSISIWKREMGSIIVSGDVILLQNVKIVKFGEIVEASTVHFSSLIPLVHPYELLVSKGVKELIACCRAGETTKEKLKKVIKWAQKTKAAFHRVQGHTHQKRQVMANWKVHEERNVHRCSSISELSCLTTSSKAAFSAFVGEIYLPLTGGSDKESDEGMMFIRRRVFAIDDNKLVEDLICLGCKLCSYPMALDNGSILQQDKFPLCCLKSSNRLHSVCFIYRPFLLYVWDESDYIPLLVTNRGAELLFGNITAEKVHLCYKEEEKNLSSIKSYEHVRGHCDLTASASSNTLRKECAHSKTDDIHSKLQLNKIQAGERKAPNFFRIWYILLKMLLQQGKNSSLRFIVNIKTGLDKENGSGDPTMYEAFWRKMGDKTTIVIPGCSMEMPKSMEMQSMMGHKQGKRSRSTQQTGERSAHNQANKTRKTPQPQANTTGSNTQPKKPGKHASKESQAEKQGQNAIEMSNWHLRMCVSVPF